MLKRDLATALARWHQGVNIERRWQQIHEDTGCEWVTPHSFRKTVAPLIFEATTSELVDAEGEEGSSTTARPPGSGCGRPGQQDLLTG
jgi:hypothetical protein